MTQAPTIAPEPAPLKLIARIQKIVTDQIAASGNAQNRKKFTDLLDYLNGGTDLPKGRKDGRAEFPSKLAVLYAKILTVLTMVRDRDPAKEIAPLVAEIEKIAALDWANYALIGDPGAGWTLEMPE
jgi:hypothetical protein